MMNAYNESMPAIEKRKEMQGIFCAVGIMIVPSFIYFSVRELFDATFELKYLCNDRSGPTEFK